MKTKNLKKAVKMEITELKITPLKERLNGKIAIVDTVTFENAITMTGMIIKEGIKGIYVKYPKNIKFENKQIRKEVSNRILATYVVNHCMDA